MKHIILSLMMTVIMCNCSPTKNYYFYTTLQSTNRDLIQYESSPFTSNNDGLDIQYSFSGQNINMQLLVNNNTSTPVFINWDKSIVKINDRAPMLISDFLKLKELKSEILETQQKSFILLNSAYFDLMSIKNKKRQPKDLFISDKKLKVKSICYEESDSPLSLTTSISFTKNEKDSIITNTFFISTISKIDKKTYKSFKLKKLTSDNGFYSLYEVDRGKENKFLDAVFDQVIKTSIYSIGNDGIRNYPQKYDEDTFYVPNR